MPADATITTGLRPEAVTRGRERLQSGPVAADVLARAILDAHALLRRRAVH
jgi:hypothetical protein